MGVLGLVYTGGDNVAHATNPPKVVAIVIARSERTYGFGDEIVIRMVFNEHIDVIGEPILDIMVGDRIREARYADHFFEILEFKYTVQLGDVAP